MSALFSGPKMPPPAPEPPAPDDPAIEAARLAERRRALLARGRRSTILTGGLGVPDTGLGRRKSLLGE